MAGGTGPFQGAGAPTSGVNEVQTLTFGGVGGTSTFKLTFRAATTEAIAWSATNATLIANILAALQALTTIQTGGVLVVNRDLVAGLGHVDITFTGVNATSDVPMLGPTQITGSLTVTAVETTKGILATERGAAPGSTYTDTLAGDLYTNDGSRFQPVWVMLAMRKVKKALAAVAGGGGVLSWQNPEGVAIFVAPLLLDIVTPSSVAATVDFGATAVSGTTSANNLLTALSVATAGAFSNMTNPGASGKAMQRLAPGAWITGTQASGNVAGLVGVAHIIYTR